MLLLWGCSKPSVTETQAKDTYFFDLKGFFHNEEERLNSGGKPVKKTVSKNDVMEEKRVTIDWQRELELFRESDINKPAWKHSYRTVSKGNTIAYIAKDNSLKTRSVRIEQGSDGKIRHIQIINKTSNFLYSSVEKLNYFPDSAYSIEKEQSVRLIGNNHYIISGRLE